MNFLAHYYFDKSDDIYHNVGLVLPDLCRTFCKGHLQLDKSFDIPQFNALKHGATKHITKDKIFHQSAYFKETQQAVSNIIDHEATWPRKWFLNHILVEIMLDRVLMDMHPTLCSQFYADLQQADTGIIEAFLKACGIEDYHLFGHQFVKFNEYQFIFNYLHNEKLIIALSKVYQKVGIKYEWGEADKIVLNKHFDSILEAVAQPLTFLTKEIKNEM